MHEKKAPGQNTPIVKAGETLLARQEEARIDAQFARMAHDAGYQALQLAVAAEFSALDWKALQASEAPGGPPGRAVV
jgi:hypothetical protein